MMYKGRRVKQTARNHKRTGRKIALLLSLVLLLGAATVGTMAYFTASDSSNSNGFTIGKVACSVTSEDDGTYTITNTGNVDAYIRVAVVANVVDEGVIQWESTSVTDDPDDGFTQHSDGFWYSSGIVKANGGTASLAVTVENGVQVKVIAEAIQGQAYAANNAWTTHQYQ